MHSKESGEGYTRKRRERYALEREGRGMHLKEDGEGCT